jgi:hypothetical protein
MLPEDGVVLQGNGLHHLLAGINFSPRGVYLLIEQQPRVAGLSFKLYAGGLILCIGVRPLTRKKIDFSNFTNMACLKSI